MSVKIKRIYDPPAQEDGLRVLVDRLWPRGLSKQSAAVDLWVRECAPSDKLRRWFAHDRKRWDEFKTGYFRELGAKTDVLRELRRHANQEPVTLLFAAKNSEYNNAVALKEYLVSPDS